ncbi:MAG: sugar phosphate isomerase/epimerase [Bryobacteraceae bacterium]
MPQLHRRALLSAFAAAGLVRGEDAVTAKTAAGFRLGVASYSLRKFSRTDAIRMVKELKTQFINIKEYHLPIKSTPEEIAVGRREFEQAGLTILGGGNIPFQKDDDADIRHKFEYAKLAGMPLIVCAPTARTLPKLEKYVTEYNIKIAVHNHGKTDEHFPTPQSVLKVVRNMDPRCGLCVDVGHTAEVGVDVVAAMAEAGDRMLDVHMKDVRDLTDADSQVPVGEGKMPVTAIFRQLQKLNYRGGVMLEYEVDENNPLPGMAKSFSYMRGVLDGLAG